MAYCSKCGAYIPEGKETCLACGFSFKTETENAKASGTAQGAAASATASEPREGEYSFKYKENSGTYNVEKDLQDKLQEQRRRQRENARKWAEENYARHQNSGRSSSTSGTYSSASHRNASGRSSSTSANYNSGVYETQKTEMSESAKIARTKLLSILSYLGVTSLLPFFIAKDDMLVRFHAKQGLALWILGMIASPIGSALEIGWVVTLLRLYLVVTGIKNAANLKMEKLPLIGDIVDRFIK